MDFIASPHIKGKVFVPSKTSDPLKKHACGDCFSCQMCSEARCQLCRGEKGRLLEELPTSDDKN